MKALPAKVIYGLAATPLVWVAWFYLYVLRQRFHLGFWPLPSHPDPKEGGYMLHHLSIYLGILLMPVFAIAVTGLVIGRRVEDIHFRWWFAIGLLVFSSVSYVGVMYLDPGDYWIWFRD